MDGIEMGSFSSKNEGYFDPWSFVMAMKSKVSLTETEEKNGGGMEGKNEGGKDEGGDEGGREGRKGGNKGGGKGRNEEKMEGEKEGGNRVRSCMSIICIYSEYFYGMILNHITNKLLCTKIFYFIPTADVYLIIFT